MHLHRRRATLWFMTTSQCGEIWTVFSIMECFHSVTFKKKPLLRFHGEEKQPNTVLAVLEQRSTEGNKNNMNLRLMNSSLESLAQNSFI